MTESTTPRVRDGDRKGTKKEKTEIKGKTWLAKEPYARLRSDGAPSTPNTIQNILH
jgi:hypothetical protein